MVRNKWEIRVSRNENQMYAISDRDIERAIHKSCGDSGFGGGYRDQWFTFRSKEEAVAAVRALRGQYKRKVVVGDPVYIDDSDRTLF